MSKRVRTVSWGCLRRALFIFGLAISCISLAEGSSRAQGVQNVQHIALAVNKSVTLSITSSFSSAVVGSPAIADALPITDRTLLIQAKKIGTTNISIFDANMHLIKVVDVEVTLDTGGLQSNIRAVTGNRSIRVSSDNGQIVLSGTAVSAPDADQAVTMAKSWSQNANVINAMRIASPQEVMLKVRFLEVDRDAGRELGINMYAINSLRNPGSKHRSRRNSRHRYRKFAHHRVIVRRWATAFSKP